MKMLNFAYEGKGRDYYYVAPKEQVKIRISQAKELLLDAPLERAVMAAKGETLVIIN